MNFGLKTLAIDMGTANTRVWLEGKGIVAREPTVVVLSTNNDEVIAMGTYAKEMLDKTPNNIVAIMPIQHGSISHFVATKSMIEEYISKYSSKQLYTKVRVVICAPSTSTDVEIRALEEATTLAGAKEVVIIDETVAAALGSGLKINEIEGKMIVDIGAGKTEAAILSQGGVIVACGIREGGNELDDAIVEQIKEKYSVVIGKTAAEEIKKEMGVVDGVIKEEYITVKGRSLATGLVELVKISSQDIEQAMAQTLNNIIKCIKKVIEKTPPELVSDVISQGVVVTGGGAYIKNIDRYITSKIEVNVSLAENPQDSVIKGTGMIIKNMEGLKRAQRRKRW